MSRKRRTGKRGVHSMEKSGKRIFALSLILAFSLNGLSFPVHAQDELFEGSRGASTPSNGGREGRVVNMEGQLALMIDGQPADSFSEICYLPSVDVPPPCTEAGEPDPRKGEECQSAELGCDENCHWKLTPHLCRPVSSSLEEEPRV